jgi:hypothetical protein
MLVRAYAKFLTYTLFAAFTALYAALSDDRITDVEWVGLVVAGATAAGVWLRQNSPSNVAAKALVAFVGTAAAFVATSITDGLSTQDWVQLVILGLGSLGVYAVPNAGSRVITTT